MVRNKYNEYAAVISVPRPVRTKVQEDQLNKEEIIINSPIRLGKGGRAIFAKLAVNHHKAIKGRAICSPRAKTIVRLWVRS